MINLPIEKKVLDHGYVALTAVMGDDRTPARTARTSFRNADKERSEEQDAKLVDYLVRNEHTTPLEFVQLRWYMKMPISVARQLVRMRTQSINEVSYRYVQAAREYYIPALDRMQKKAESNKQGSSEEVVDYPEMCQAVFYESCERSFDAYENLLRMGLAPELARNVLPCGTYTEWYAQMNIHNFFNSIARLRTTQYAEHAQYETKQYADAMLEMTELAYPVITGSWRRKMEAKRG